MASVFDQDELTRTMATAPSNESRVMLLKTARTAGAIATPSYLQYENVQANNLLVGANMLLPGTEQILVLSGDEAAYSFGNLNVFIQGSAPPDTTVTEPDAYMLTVGKDRQTMIQGLDMTTKANRTGFKQEFWDTETSTNVDQVKASYFVVTSTVQNDEIDRFTFGAETLIQWGDRTLDRWSTEARTTVGHTTGTIVGNTQATNHGSLHENNYAGVSLEAVNGGTDFHFSLGLKSMYQEGFSWTTNIGTSLTMHLENFIMQGIGTGAAVMDVEAVQTQLNSGIASVKAHGVRVGTGLLNLLTGVLGGTPRV